MNLFDLTEVKSFIKSELGVLAMITFCFCFILLAFEVYQTQEITKLRNVVHHRYFNSVTTTEQLYGIKINTLNGEIKQVYSSPYKR